MVAVGVGQCCWDTIALVDRYPEPDGKAEASAWAEEGGGPTATAMVCLARWGIPCRFLGVVGDDVIGERIQAGLLAEGIDARLTVRPHAHSQRAAITVERQTGRRTIVWQRPGGAPLQPAELPADLLADARLLLLDGLMPAASLAAAHQARAQGVPVLLDAGRDRPGMGDLAALCTHVVAGEQYARDLGWDGTIDDFRRLARHCGYPVFTVTCGERGSYTWAAGELLPVPALPVAALDTTGAGDVFHGGFGFGLLQGWDLPQILRFATAAAAAKCRSLGGRQGIPPLADLLD
jgi:ribokinase